MKKTNKIVKKPFAALLVLVFVAAAIFYIESQKPDISIVRQNNSASHPKAPDFAGIEKWINSDPLKMEQLRGNVVLVDFWTYTCINCIRTLPYIKDWDRKYRDKGLVIVGIHTPEFEFEKKYENVLKAVNDYRLEYPVAQDNNYVTWSMYQNRYWPHKFLIDIDGYIRYDHIGEGAYEETEKMIQALLLERMERLDKKGDIKFNTTIPEEIVSHQNIGTPEIYFGYQFDRGNLGYNGLRPDAIADFKFSTNPYKNLIYLDGKWKYNADSMELVSDEGSILLIFQAKSINMVAGSESGSEAFIFLNNAAEGEGSRGFDVEARGNSSISAIKEFKLYNLANAEAYGTNVLEIDVIGKGFKIYTFTFG